MKFIQLAFGYILGRTIIVYTLLPLYFRGKLFTAYQVLHTRFGGATKQAASLLFLVTRNLGDGLRLFLAAIVLQSLSGLSLETCVIGTGMVTLVYTFFGGLRSVVWSDCLQLVIYLLGGAATLAIIIYNLPGGWGEFTDFAMRHDKLRVFDWRWSISDPYTFWAGLLGGAALTLGTHGTDHMMVQRYLSARSQADAGQALIASGFVVCAQFALFLLIGVGFAAYYSNYPETRFTSHDAVYADFIVRVFPRNTGLVGLMLAAILAAAMSTLSSSLNSSASALVNDFYASWRSERLSDRHLFLVTRGTTIAFGLLQIVIGIAALQFQNTVIRNALTIAGFSAGLLLGVFALGVLVPRAGQLAALAGLAAGLAILLFARFVAPEYGITVAFPWLPLIGCTTTFAVGLLITIGSPRGRPDP
jgi:SSS family transporter